MKFKVVTQPGEQSGFVATVPALVGCWSQGATREEATKNVREAAEGWLEAQKDPRSYLSTSATNLPN